MNSSKGALLARFVTQPFWLVIIPASASFAIWISPWPSTVRRGFIEQQDLTVMAAAGILAWYLTTAVAARAGWLLGRSSVPNQALNAADDDRVYSFLTKVAFVGVGGMYLLVIATAPGLIVHAFSTHQFSLVREAVPKAPGIATLRYASILAGAIAIHRLVVLRKYRPVHVLNVFLLILNVLVASRLALIMCTLVFVGLTFARQRSEPIGLRPRRLLAVFVGVVLLLGWANYVRNANFYETFYGTRNPAAMLAGEIVSYVGSPFQIAVAGMNDHSVQPDADKMIDGVADLVTPTFLSGAPTSTATAWYRTGQVSIEPGLTTLSSFAEVYGKLGFGLSYLFMALACFGAGTLMGHLSRYRSYMVLGTFVVGYCFAELWRTYLFDDGIIWFLLLVLAAACFGAGDPVRQTRQAVGRARQKS